MFDQEAHGRGCIQKGRERTHIPPDFFRDRVCGERSVLQQCEDIQFGRSVQDLAFHEALGQLQNFFRIGFICRSLRLTNGGKEALPGLEFPFCGLMLLSFGSRGGAP